jgi:hypothetical protein
MPDLGSIITSAAGAANPVTAIVGLGKDIIDKFVPDPHKKAEAQAHVLDVQAQIQQSLIEQQNEIIKATSSNVKDDQYMKAVRAFFSVSMTCLYLWNYAICRFFGQVPLDIPMSLTTMFGCMMLGFVGIPAGIEATKQIMLMPGESSVSTLGWKAKNVSPPPSC